MALREVLADLSVRVRGTRQLQGANRGVNAFVGNMRAAAGALGAAGAAITSALAIGQVAAFTKELIDLGDELGKTAQQLGADHRPAAGVALRGRPLRCRRPRHVSELHAAAASRVRRRAWLAHAGGGFRCARRAAPGRERPTPRAPDELMRQMARGMAGLEDETAKVALAQTLMGRSGARLLPLLNGGEEGRRGVARALPRARRWG
ncbi:MAG: hypothetical protein SangKO_075710 [Sandaracinaceae bacterium]